MAPRRTKKSEIGVETQVENIEPVVVVDDKPITIEIDDDIIPQKKEPVKQSVKHSYDDKNCTFTAVKEDGKKLEFYTPELLSNDYCTLIRKFISLSQGVSIGKYSAGTYKTISYDELENVPDGSLIYAHCYNTVSETNISVLEKVISKLKFGGKLFVADTSTDLTKVLQNINNIGVRFCGYGYKIFNHNYWHNNKNISIALVTKG